MIRSPRGPRGRGPASPEEEVLLRLAHTTAAVLVAASAALLSASCAPPASKRAEALPFIADDYHRALDEARARKLPIFVECWAPW